MYAIGRRGDSGGCPTRACTVRVGDRVRFDGQVWDVGGLDADTVYPVGIVERWFRWRLDLPDAQQLHARLQQRHDDKRSADLWAAAYYPTTIAVLRIMLSAQHGRFCRPLPPTVIAAARERVAVEVTSGYTPSGGFDPFLHWLNSPPSDRDEAASSELLG